MPDEYVLTGRSIESSSSANATISSKRSRILARERPCSAPFSSTFSRPVKSGWKPAPSSSSDPIRPPVCDAPVRRPDDPRDQPEQRRLSRAVPADQPHRLAGRDRDGDVAERPDLLRAGAAAGDEELLERLRLARADDELPGDAVDRDLSGAHPAPYAATAASSRRTMPASTSTSAGRRSASRSGSGACRAPARARPPRRRCPSGSRGGPRRSRRGRRGRRRRPRAERSERWSRMSGPSHGSPVGDSLWKAKLQSPTPAAPATRRLVSSNASR